MIKKMVDGFEVICSDDEERVIRKHWLLNETYPEYASHLAFDGISEPFFVMDECKKRQKDMVKGIIENKISSINLQIESAEEEGNEDIRKSLIGKRKSLKAGLVYDDSKWNEIQELKSHLESVKGL